MSDARALYQATIVDHDRHPRNHGPLAGADRAATVDNPLCGDVVTIEPRLADATIAAAGWTGRGCALARAAGTMLIVALAALDAAAAAGRLDALEPRADRGHGMCGGGMGDCGDGNPCALGRGGVCHSRQHDAVQPRPCRRRLVGEIRPYCGGHDFIVTPLTFLSGTFYSAQQLPGIWNTLVHYNPFFYMIDGFRYGFIGHADGNLMAGLTMLVVINLLLGWMTLHMLKTGYKIKS